MPPAILGGIVMPQTGRAFVLTEATLPQVQELKPNVAIQPWGATEAHNYHLPHGTDCVEVTAVADGAVTAANAMGARCILLPTMPYGNDNLQLDQAATITMRTATQYHVMRDIAYSLVRQGIDRLVILNGHGGNEFSAMIRDIMIEYPIFIVRINGYHVDPSAMSVLENRNGDHANEMETSLMMYLKPEWCGPIETAADGAVTPSKLPKLTANPATWYPRHWKILTASTGVGDPRKGTAAKGEHIYKAQIAALAPILVELSNAKLGDFPYVTSAASTI
jgi:creatinine amidohydrolase